MFSHLQTHEVLKGLPKVFLVLFTEGRRENPEKQGFPVENTQRKSAFLDQESVGKGYPRQRKAFQGRKSTFPKGITPYTALVPAFEAFHNLHDQPQPYLILLILLLRYFSM